MGTKKLTNTHWTVDQANQQIQQQFEPDYWSFLINQVNYTEVNWDAEEKQIVFSEFIPLKTLLDDVLDRIARDDIAVTQCQVCQQFSDFNHDEGIFGEPDNLAHFICRTCAHSLSAWEFYQNHLKI